VDFADERYIRLYTRDTATWKLLNWQAKCIVGLLLRKCDRAGVIEFGGAEMAPAITALIDIPMDVVEPGIASLAERDVIELHDHWLVFPNFIDAQEAKTNDKRRAAEYRARRRDRARRAKLARGSAAPGVTPRDDSSRHVTQQSLFEDQVPVTPRDDSSQDVTEPKSGPRAHSVTLRDDSSQGVTESRLGAEPRITPRDENPENRHTASQTVTPSLAVPSRTHDRDLLGGGVTGKGVAGAAAPPTRTPPVRPKGLCPAPISVADYEPLPEHATYAAEEWGLTVEQFEETVSELRNREATRPRSGGNALAEYLDRKLNGFIEERGRQLRANGRANDKRGKGRSQKDKPPAPKQTNEVDLSMLDDEDREMLGEYLAGLE